MAANGPKGKITKTEMVGFMAGSMQISKVAAASHLEALEQYIVKNLKGGYDVVFGGMGVFRKRTSNARMGLNPQTGESIKIAAKKKVKFSPSKGLKEAVL